MIKINEQSFEALPGVQYKYDYEKIATKIAKGEWKPIDNYRALILDDLFFIVRFVLKVPIANQKFVVDACREVEEGPKDYTLDVWAREHFKSTIITIAETIQYILKNPDHAVGIFSYVRPVSKKFLGSIMDVFQNEKMLKVCFPDVVYEDCEKQTQWSKDDGLILRRKTTRKEPTLSAWGLVEGMPTGLHFERRVYDDISTEDIAESPDMMEKVKTKFDSSQNIGTDGGTHRVIGTYYHHNDPLTYIRGKKKLGSDEPQYVYRFKPATDDGTSNGVPVFLSQKRLDDLKGTRTFNCQQLLDPSPLEDMKLNPDLFLPIERRMIPKDVYRFMLVDQAGDLDSAKIKTRMDSWAVGVVAVEPFSDDLGQSRVFLEDVWINPASESEAIDQIVRMYLKAGMIMKLGVEKVGAVTTHIHVANALRAHGRYVSWDTGGNGVLLRPAGRNKRKMIEAALSWPMNNGKIFYSTSCPTNYIERLKMEMRNFPVWHDDGINMLAYLYDVLKDYWFGMAEEMAEEQKKKRYAPTQPVRGWMSI